MAFVVADRTQETCTSPGTGVVTLLGAVNQFQSFLAGVGANNTTYYVITDQNGSNWEAGLGTIGATGLTLTRTTILSSSNAGSIVNFSTGTQNIWCDYPASKAVYGTGTTLVAPAGTLLPVANGGTGQASSTGSGAVVLATSPTITSPDTAGTPTGVGVLTSGTAIASTSGTSINFTGIPSWAKRITVMFRGVSTSGASFGIVQLGSTTIKTSGYDSIRWGISSSSGFSNSTTIGLMAFAGSAIDTSIGSLVITNLSGNEWVSQGSVYLSSSAGVTHSGGVGLAGALDRIRITTVNGTDTFDAGSINIMYE